MIEATASIVLNSVGLAVTNGEYTSGSDKIPAKDIREKYDERIEFLLEKTIPKGEMILTNIIDINVNCLYEIVYITYLKTSIYNREQVTAFSVTRSGAV